MSFLLLLAGRQKSSVFHVADLHIDIHNSVCQSFTIKLIVCEVM